MFIVTVVVDCFIGVLRPNKRKRQVAIFGMFVVLHVNFRWLKWGMEVVRSVRCVICTCSTTGCHVICFSFRCPLFVVRLPFSAIYGFVIDFNDCNLIKSKLWMDGCKYIFSHPSLLYPLPPFPLSFIDIVNLVG